MGRLATFAVLAAAALGTAACGFHLAGSRAPALGRVAVVYEDPYRVVPPPLVDVLRSRLNGEAGEPAGRLVIRDIDDQRRVLAVSPVDGRAIAYELVSTVRFDFSAGGGSGLADQVLSVRRTYSFDDTERLAAETERRELIEAMHAELADLILLRLETALADYPRAS